MTAANFISGMIGVTIGALFGFTFAAILIIGRQSDPRGPEDREYSLSMEDKIVAIEDKLTEPTRIFTKGCLVKWGNTVHEIDFIQERNGQTVARLSAPEGEIGVIVPIEELEAVEE